METKHWLITFNNQWKQLLGKYNWYSFTPINIYFEKDNFTHGYEFEITLLGLGIVVRYNTDKALNHFDKWSKDVDEWLKDDK